MKIIVSSDEHSPLIDCILEEAEKAGHACTYVGPQPEEEMDWPDVTRDAVSRMVAGEFDEAIVLCWTGTGATMAANKVPGVRAALCADAETARGARVWNHANTLGLSMRLTSVPLAREILKTWFSTPYSDDDWNRKQIARIEEMDRRGGSLD